MNATNRLYGCASIRRTGGIVAADRGITGFDPSPSHLEGEARRLMASVETRLESLGHGGSPQAEATIRELAEILAELKQTLPSGSRSV